MTEKPFCGDEFINFSKYYEVNFAGYANISIALFGSVFNTFNLLVFTRKNMISPASLIFTHLSFIDLAVLLASIPNSWNSYFGEEYIFVDKRWSYEWLMFLLYSADFMAASHSISVWLTVMLTIWRYIAVVHPLKESNWCNMKITRYVMIFGYILCAALSMPQFFSHETDIIYVGERPAYIAKFKKDFYDFIFINNGVLLKLIPSVVLTVFSCRLVVFLLATKKDHDKLTLSSKSQNLARNIKMKQQVDRSTRILLAVLVLFLIVEVPMGILSLLILIYGGGIHQECYNLIGVMFDTLALFNTSITFLVYYAMSQQFRTTFISLFNRKKSFPGAKDTLLRKISGSTITSQF